MNALIRASQTVLRSQHFNVGHCPRIFLIMLSNPSMIAQPILYICMNFFNFRPGVRAGVDQFQSKSLSSHLVCHLRFDFARVVVL